MKLKKRQILFLLFLIAGTIFVALNNKNAQEEPAQGEVRKFSERIFGTIMNITYTSEEDLHDTIMTCLKEVDASLSMFNPKSTISRINRNETDSLDNHLMRILPMALSVSEATDGAFDISVAPLVNAWGFGFKSGSLPTDAQVDSLKSLVGYKHICVKDNRIIKNIPDMIIDLSAIAKGYGTDQVAQLLEENGVKDFIVEIGGEIVCRGNNPKGEAWHVGINKPIEQSALHGSEIQEVLDIHNKAMATSGNYRNFYIDEQGRKLSHTIDPQSGYPVRHSLLSSTVIAPSCAMADAYATSFMVMGLENAKNIVLNNKDLQAYFIYCNNDSTENFEVWTNIDFK